MREQGLLVTKINRYKAKRKISRPKPKASYPNHIWGTDMTKIKIGSWGWYYLVIVLDWYSKEIIGHLLSLQSKSKDWQETLTRQSRSVFPKASKIALEARFIWSLTMAVNRLPFPICRPVLPWGSNRSLPVGPTPKGMPIPKG